MRLFSLFEVFLFIATANATDEDRGLKGQLLSSLLEIVQLTTTGIATYVGWLNLNMGSRYSKPPAMMALVTQIWTLSLI